MELAQDVIRIAGTGPVGPTGDAAHFNLPSGGKAMNDGIRDACKLADLTVLESDGADRDVLDAKRRQMARDGTVAPADD